MISLVRVYPKYPKVENEFFYTLEEAYAQAAFHIIRYIEMTRGMWAISIETDKSFKEIEDLIKANDILTAVGKSNLWHYRVSSKVDNFFISFFEVKPSILKGTINTIASDGAYCTKCNSYNEYIPRSISYICYSCKS